MEETLKELNSYFNTIIFNELDLKPIDLVAPYIGYSIGKSEQPKYGIGITGFSIYILVYEPARNIWWRAGDKMELCPEIKGLASSYHVELSIWTKEQLLETLTRIKKLKP